MVQNPEFEIMNEIGNVEKALGNFGHFANIANFANFGDIGLG